MNNNDRPLADPDSAATLVQRLRWYLERANQGCYPSITSVVIPLDLLHSAAEALERETAIVDRIWDIFGRPSYAELKGRSIYDLIQEKIDAVDTLSKQLAGTDAVLKAATEFSEIVWHHGMPEQAGPIQIRLTALLKATRDHDMRHTSRVGQKDEERKA